MVPVSALNQADYVNPRPAFVDAIESVMSQGAEGVIVQSSFDAPAVRHAAQKLGLDEAFVIPASEPMIMLPRHALLLTRSWCDQARKDSLKLFNGRGQNLRITKLQELRGICSVLPKDFEVANPRSTEP